MIRASIEGVWPPRNYYESGQCVTSGEVYKFAKVKDRMAVEQRAAENGLHLIRNGIRQLNTDDTFGRLVPLLFSTGHTDHMDDDDDDAKEGINTAGRVLDDELLRELSPQSVTGHLGLRFCAGKFDSNPLRALIRCEYPDVVRYERGAFSIVSASTLYIEEKNLTHGVIGVIRQSGRDVRELVRIGLLSVPKDFNPNAFFCEVSEDSGLDTQYLGKLVCFGCKKPQYSYIFGNTEGFERTCEFMPLIIPRSPYSKVPQTDGNLGQIFYKLCDDPNNGVRVYVTNPNVGYAFPQKAHQL